MFTNLKKILLFCVMIMLLSIFSCPADFFSCRQSHLHCRDFICLGCVRYSHHFQSAWHWKDADGDIPLADMKQSEILLLCSLTAISVIQEGFVSSVLCSAVDAVLQSYPFIFLMFDLYHLYMLAFNLAVVEGWTIYRTKPFRMLN